MGYLAHLISQLGKEKFNCEYWDVRVEDSVESSIELLNGDPTTCSVSPSLGAFLRVRKNGFWLYEATTEISNLKQSLTLLCQNDPTKGNSYEFQVSKQSPYINIQYDHNKMSSIPLEEKLHLVVDYFTVIRKNNKVVSTQLIYKDLYKIKSYLNSEGTQFEFDFNQGGIRLAYSLKEGDSIFSDRIDFYGTQFNDLKNKESMIQEELLESELFIHARVIEPGKYKVLLAPDVAGVFTHESFGHRSEADFMLGDEQALKDWKIGSTIGADILSIVDYGNHQGTSGYCPIDDEGTRAQKNHLIKNGVLSGRLHSMDTAIQLKEMPTGNARAMSFEHEPIVRMTSTYIEPGKESLDSIIKRSEGAILLKNFRHGSGLSTFTIAPNRAYLLGKEGSKIPVRVSVVSGTVFETLKNIEAVSTDFILKNSAIGGCGKGEQWPLPVSIGGPFVLVKEMQVS